ncbi:MAG: hypothetical protein ICV56_08420, partial [Nitrososphaeraceae archaeon]|nr:hypothetical protein [Nitrososphaeraceae archaeon]
MSLEVLDILRVIALLSFAGGTSFLGALISKYKKFGDQQILFLTSFGAGILISAAIFEMVIEAERIIGIALTLLSFIG